MEWNTIRFLFFIFLNASYNLINFKLCYYFFEFVCHWHFEFQGFENVASFRCYCHKPPSFTLGFHFWYAPHHWPWHLLRLHSSCCFLYFQLFSQIRFEHIWHVASVEEEELTKTVFTLNLFTSITSKWLLLGWHGVNSICHWNFIWYINTFSSCWQHLLPILLLLILILHRSCITFKRWWCT